MLTSRSPCSLNSDRTLAPRESSPWRGSFSPKTPPSERATISLAPRNILTSNSRRQSLPRNSVGLSFHLVQCQDLELRLAENGDRIQLTRRVGTCFNPATLQPHKRSQFNIQTPRPNKNPNCILILLRSISSASFIYTFIISVLKFYSEVRGCASSFTMAPAEVVDDLDGEWVMFGTKASTDKQQGARKHISLQHTNILQSTWRTRMTPIRSSV